MQIGEEELATPDIDVEAEESDDASDAAVADAVPVPDVDLSKVPEKVRKYVDAEKYTSNEDYKRAIEHGWKPKELHAEEGGDEADFTGFRQFNRRYDDRQTLKELKQGQDALISTINHAKEEAVSRALAQKESELQAAFEQGDAKRAVELSNEITNTKAQVTPPQQSNEPPPVMAARNKNSFLNKQSSDFNEGLNQQFEAECFRLASDYHNSVNYGVPNDRRRPLSQLELKSIVSEALDMVKEKLPPPRVQQKAPAVSKPAAQPPKNTDLKKGLSASAQSTYNRLMKVGGKEAADSFAKEMLGGGQ